MLWCQSCWWTCRDYTELWSLTLWLEKIFTAHTKRRRRALTAHTRVHYWRGSERKYRVLFAIIRYRMKEWDALERKKRRMWESEFIQHFDESGFFTGIMLNMKPSGFWTYCWWALLSTALSYVKKNPWCQNLISDVVVWFYYTEYAQWPSKVMFSWKDVLYF